MTGVTLVHSPGLGKWQSGQGFTINDREVIFQSLGGLGRMPRICQVLKRRAGNIDPASERQVDRRVVLGMEIRDSWLQIPSLML